MVLLMTDWGAGAVWALAHGGAWALMLLAAGALGSACVSRLRFASSEERAVFALAAGLGLWACGLFALALCGALYRPAIWALTVAGAAAGIWRWWRAGVAWRRDRWRPVVILGLAAVPSILLAQYPPTQWDAIANHLFLARDYLEAHRLTAPAGIAQPVLPTLNHMLFAWALALGDEALAQLVEVTFLMLTAFGLYAWGARVGRPLMGLGAAAFWLSHPLVIHLGYSAYVDVALTCYAFLSVYALRVFWDGGEEGWWYLGAAAAGFAAGTKMTGLFFVGLGACVGLAERLRQRGGWAALARGWALAALLGAPWYAPIAYHTGNPLWPMFPQFGREVKDPAAAAAGFDEWVNSVGLPKTATNFLLLPLRVVDQPRRFSSETSRGLFFLIVVWPLAWVVAAWDPSVRWWTCWAVAYTLFWFASAQFLRYWLPALPLIALALSESVAWFAARLTESRLVQGALWAAPIMLSLAVAPAYFWVAARARGAAPTSPEGRQAYLQRHLPGYRGAEFVNRFSGPGDTAYIVNGNYLTYYLRPRVTGFLPGIGFDPATAALVWPKDEAWAGALESVTWLVVLHDARRLPPDPGPAGGPARSYQLVYADRQVYVFRRAPVPPEMLEQVTAPPCAEGAPAAAGYEGGHDGADCERIAGWAWDMWRPDCAVSVDIYDGDLRLATVPADNLREDALRAGRGNGRHGFSYPTPARLRDGRTHFIRVLIAGTQIELARTRRPISCAP